MTQLGADNFIRANTAGSTTISNAAGWGTSSDGQSYSENGAGATFSIDTNRGKITGTTTSINVYMGSRTTADGEILVRVTFDTTGNKVGPIAREVGNNNWYWTRLTGTTIDIVKNVAGTQTTIATASFTASTSTAYWIRFRVVGSAQMARAWQDGTAENNISGGTGWQVTAADTALSAAGQFGVRSSLVAAGNINWFDSLYAVDYLWCDVFPVSDSLLVTSDTMPGFVETLAISDIGGGSLQSWNVDALSASDSASFTADTTSGFVEFLPVVESVLYTQTTIPVEALSTVDAFLTQGEGVWVELIPTSDAFRVGVAYIPIEGLFSLDSFFAQSGFVPVEALSITNLQSALQSWGVDVLSLTENFRGTSTFVSVEVLSASETLLATESASFTDALVLSDLFRGALDLIVFGAAVIWVTRDMQTTWKARDMNVTWKTRG